MLIGSILFLSKLMVAPEALFSFWKGGGLLFLLIFVLLGGGGGESPGDYVSFIGFVGGGSALVGVFLCSIGQFCCWVTMSGNIFLILLAYILLGVLYFTRCFVLWSISSSLSAILLCG